MGLDPVTLRPPMALSTGVFELQKVVDLESLGSGQRSSQRLLGQVASIQVTPDASDIARGSLLELLAGCFRGAHDGGR